MLFLPYYFILLTAAFHPFHVSVSSVRYASAEKTLQITMKIFADDLEEALNEKPYRHDGEPYIDVLNPENPDTLSQKVAQYILKHFEVTVNGEIAETTCLGYEIEDLAMWYYMEVQDVKKVKNIRIRNTVLTDTFEDQVNIVHVDCEDVIKSMKLSGNKLVGEVEFE